MEKFKFTPEDYGNAMEWAKTYVIEEGKTLYDAIQGLPSSEEKLHLVNRYRG
jgi:hypothetical protein